MILHLLTRCFLFAYLFLAMPLEAIDYSPWSEEPFLLNASASSLYQKYAKVSSGDQAKKKRAQDVFLTASLNGYLPKLSLQLQAIQAFTKMQKGAVDHFAATLKYHYLDDIAGDFISLTFGGSFLQPFRWSLKDISSFHHGLVEGECFLAIGKEKSYLEDWEQRWSLVTSIGLAEQGSAWVRLNCDYAFRFLKKQTGKIFFHSLMGLGDKNLNLCHFKGYGAIAHRSIDIGMQYSYLFENLSKLHLKYAYRVYAKNFPLNSQCFTIEYCYDFALDELFSF